MSVPVVGERGGSIAVGTDRRPFTPTPRSRRVARRYGHRGPWQRSDPEHPMGGGRRAHEIPNEVRCVGTCAACSIPAPRRFAQTSVAVTSRLRPREGRVYYEDHGRTIAFWASGRLGVCASGRLGVGAPVLDLELLVCHEAEVIEASWRSASWMIGSQENRDSPRNSPLPRALDRPGALAALCPTWSAIGCPYSSADFGHGER
jgi:hypothetical protein